MTYKTPDVYVEEISIFPPSVAEVETAIPAFIGYTKRTQHKGIEYKHKAVKIDSLVEYEEIFGQGPALNITSVNVDGVNSVTEMEIASTFYLYDSLKLFFANGGGKCYILPCGTYEDSILNTDFESCLSTLSKEDEPTIILFPDAINLSSTQFYQLQKDALAQAGKLGDRVVVMDMLTENGEAKIQDFRDSIGMQHLKYGAAYTPYLKTNFTKTVRYLDFFEKVFKGGSQYDLENLASGDSEIINNIRYIEQLNEDKKKISSLTSAAYKALYDADVLEVKSAVSKAPKNKALLKNLYDGLANLETLALTDLSGITLEDSAAFSSTNSLVEYAKTVITGIEADVELLNSYNAEGAADISEDGSSGLLADNSALTWDSSIWTIDAVPTASTEIDVADSPSDKNEKLLSLIAPIAQKLISAYQEVENAAAALENSLESFIFSTVTTIKNIATAISTSEAVIPPSGAIAGVYASVDNARGVWKAPANVSLSGVTGLTEKIDSDDQEDLNVDVTAGKSINALREFSGKGILVWGARTLAGNDNEWRYVPVRRFFNMVEESIKKSTYWAVFEPNDANLWVKLKSMIENYLIQKWREGALAGAKPEQAFYVNVGLGKTMTAQDILEGRLVIDIGMAAVRPAEFIILRFMHKMQES